jgi:predicted nucleic acid binding AN1-type Zn finger protein
MTNLSARTWVLMGFALSLFSVVVNIFILSGISEKIKDADGEIVKLQESLRLQALDVHRAELKFDLFMILNNLSKISTGDAKKIASEDSNVMLQDFMTIYYSAVNEIPANALLKAESDKLSALLPVIEKMREAEKQAKAGNNAEAEKLAEEAQTMAANYQPSALQVKLDEATKFAEAEGVQEMTTTEITSEMAPHIKSLIEQYVSNYNNKEAKIRELQDKKANLTWWSNLATYAAVSLQLFGLMFVLAKDLVSDAATRKQSEIIETEEFPADPETNAIRNDECEEMLAELKEEIRLAIEDKDSNEKNLN